MDCRKLKFKDASIDFVIDKSTLDCLLCGGKAFRNTARMLKEVQRVLKTGGIYLVISFSGPERRMTHLQRAHLGFAVEVVPLVRVEGGQKIVSGC
jgi:hypothetical protein